VRCEAGKKGRRGEGEKGRRGEGEKGRRGEGETKTLRKKYFVKPLVKKSKTKNQNAKGLSSSQ